MRKRTCWACKTSRPRKHAVPLAFGGWACRASVLCHGRFWRAVVKTRRRILDDYRLWRGVSRFKSVSRAALDMAKARARGQR